MSTTSGTEPTPVDVRLATWNVWFGGYMLEERCDALLEELGRRAPDVIMLQEVTSDLLERILRTKWIRNDYRLSGIDLVQSYDVLLLSRLPVAEVDWLELPSNMGRKLVAAKLACGLTVGTVHLESTEHCAEQRADQLRIIQPALLEVSDDVVLAGDMNFGPDDDIENAACDTSFIDVWPAVHGRDVPGYTVDSKRNKMRQSMKGGGKRSGKRIDRVFAKSLRWQPKSIELLGTTPFDPIDDTFISDHFGLEAVLAFRLPDQATR